MDCILTRLLGLGRFHLIFHGNQNNKANINGALRKLNVQVSGRISVVMSTFSIFGLSYGCSDNEFWHILIEIPGVDPLPARLPRNEELSDNL